MGEIARRHIQPRYVPLASQRGTGIDPARPEHTHPSWCDCTRCTPRVPADEPRGVVGCLALIGAVTLALILVAALCAVSAVSTLRDKVGGAAVAGIVVGIAIVAIGGTPALTLIFRSF